MTIETYLDNRKLTIFDKAIEDGKNLVELDKESRKEIPMPIIGFIDKDKILIERYLIPQRDQVTTLKNRCWFSLSYLKRIKEENVNGVAHPHSEFKPDLRENISDWDVLKPISRYNEQVNITHFYDGSFLVYVFNKEFATAVEGLVNEYIEDMKDHSSHPHDKWRFERFKKDFKDLKQSLDVTLLESCFKPPKDLYSFA